MDPNQRKINIIKTVERKVRLTMDCSLSASKLLRYIPNRTDTAPSETVAVERWTNIMTISAPTETLAGKTRTSPFICSAIWNNNGGNRNYRSGQVWGHTPVQRVARPPCDGTPSASVWPSPWQTPSPPCPYLSYLAEIFATISAELKTLFIFHFILIISRIGKY